MAEFGFFGVVVYTLVHTPCFGHCSKCIDLERFIFGCRGLRISCYCRHSGIPRLALTFYLHLAKAKCYEFFSLCVPTNENAAFAPILARTKRYVSRGSGIYPDLNYYIFGFEMRHSIRFRRAYMRSRLICQQ